MTNFHSVLFDARWIGPHGIGRFATEVRNRIEMTDLDQGPSPSSPVDPLYLSKVLRSKAARAFFTPGYNVPLYSRMPLVLTLHDLMHVEFPENSSTLKRLYYNRITRPAARRSAWVLTVSEYSRTQILNWLGGSSERVVTVGNGVDARFSAEGAKHDAGFPYFLYVGNTRPHKNVRRLLEAYARSGVSGDIKLMFCGAVDDDVLQHAASLGLSDQVVKAGLVPEAQLPSYYRGAAALLLPSLYEGFGLPPLEAMASGVPVLTSNTTSLPEVVGDAGMLVNPLDVEQIADGIRRLASDSALRASLREKGLARARLFSWDETARRTKEVLQAAMS